MLGPLVVLTNVSSRIVCFCFTCLSVCDLLYLIGIHIYVVAIFWLVFLILFSIIIYAGWSKFSWYNTISNKGCFQHDPRCKLSCQFSNYWFFKLHRCYRCLLYHVQWSTRDVSVPFCHNCHLSLSVCVKCAHHSPFPVRLAIFMLVFVITYLLQGYLSSMSRLVIIYFCFNLAWLEASYPSYF